MVFFLNVFCNFIILLLITYILKWKIPLKRLILGSIIASSSIFVMLYMDESFLHSIIWKILFSFIIIFVTFGRRVKHHLVTTYITFIGTYILFGGVLMMIHFIWTERDPMMNMTDQHISATFVISFFPLIAYATKKQTDYILHKKMTYDQCYTVDLTVGGQTVSTNGFVDTGNQLYDPLTNKPVAFMNSHLFKRLYPRLDWVDIQDKLEDNNLYHLPKVLQERISAVPFIDITGVEQFTHVLILDKLEIQFGNDHIVWKRIPIGIHRQRLTEDNQYECLLHPAHLTFGKK